ncbi:MAG: hypothetical protein ACTTH5_04155 [Wolinella sp.]
MHGKILYYNEEMGTGTLTNQHRRIFEFTRQSWYGRRSLPERDMLVDFRLDDRENVSGCKESCFRRLCRTHPIKESDFWLTADDEKLKERAEELKESLILQGVSTLDPNAPIPVELPINRCFDLYFSEELALLERYEELFSNPARYPVVDYSKLKPFLQKAKTHLLGADSSIRHENFSELEQEIRRTETLLADMGQILTKDAEIVFEEMFLRAQIPYLRAHKRLGLEEERISQLERRLKKLPFDMNFLQQKIKGAEPKEREPLNEKLNALKSEGIACQSEIAERTSNKESLVAQIELFKKKNFEELMGAYHFEDQRKKLYAYLKRVLDHFGYMFDLSLWQSASRSSNIANSFYTQSIQGGFNAFTFLQYYLKPLDKHRLSAQDKALYRYFYDYEKKDALKFLIVGEDSEFIATLKRRLFLAQKDVIVYTFLRAVDSLAMVKSMKVNAVFMDTEIRSMGIYEWLEHFIKHTPSQKAIIFGFSARGDEEREQTLKEKYHCIPLRKGISEQKFEEMMQHFIPMIQNKA